jgi:hypothetical protein
MWFLAEHMRFLEEHMRFLEEHMLRTGKHVRFGPKPREGTRGFVTTPTCVQRSGGIMKRALAVLALVVALPLAAEEPVAKDKLVAQLIDLLDVGRLTDGDFIQMPRRPEVPR